MRGYLLRGKSIGRTLSAVLLLGLALVLSGCSFFSQLFGFVNSGVPLNVPACTTSGPLFTVLPVQTSVFNSFVPLGNLDPSGHVFPTDHHYFFVQNPTVVFPVTVPSDGVITKFEQTDHQTKGFTDYAVTMYACTHVKVIFGHISTMPSNIMNKIGSMSGANCQTYSTGGETVVSCTKAVNVPVTAGESLGTGGGNPNQFGIDFGVYDDRVTAQLVGLSHFSHGERYVHAVSAIPYFDSQDQTILKNSTWDFSHSYTRTVPPIGGTVSQDVGGTAQGIWFLAGQPLYPEDPQFAFVHDNFDPSIPVISVGTSIPGLSAAAYRVTTVQLGGTKNRDPSAVLTDGQIYSYSLPNGVLIMQLVSTTQLRVEYAQGSTIPTAFSPNSVLFER